MGSNTPIKRGFNWGINTHTIKGVLICLLKGVLIGLLIGALFIKRCINTPFNTLFIVQIIPILLLK